MNDNSVSKQTKPLQLIIVFIVVGLILAICAYCFYSIYEAKQVKVERQAYHQKQIRESDGTWGVEPQVACTVYEEIGLMGLDYKPLLNDPSKYGCNSLTVDIPSKKGKKTLQYRVSGFPQKATHFTLILTIQDDLNSEESIAARKSWAVYAAVLYTQLFGQTVGEFSEIQMQQLADLSPNSPVTYYKDGKLLITADVKVNEGVGIYTFNIDGLPNLKF